jgi:hypothetical protein
MPEALDPGGAEEWVNTNQSESDARQGSVALSTQLRPPGSKNVLQTIPRRLPTEIGFLI